MENRSTLVALLEQKYESAIASGEQDIHSTLMAGLEWETNHWVDLAIEWIEQGCPINQAVSNQLKNISEKKHFPQRTRHKSIKLHKRWEREKST